MRNMAHYPSHNPGVARFIGGLLVFGLILCMALYLAGLYYSFGGPK